MRLRAYRSARGNHVRLARKHRVSYHIGNLKAALDDINKMLAAVIA